MTAPLRPDVAAAVAAARRAEYNARLELRPVPPAPHAPVSPAGAPAKLLKVCYLAPRTDIGGGARVLFEHANRLTARGHEVTVLSHFPAPGWFDLRARFRRVPFGVELAEAAPAADAIVAGYWDQILAARALGAGPVVHFEQGDFHLFEDVDRPTREIASRNLVAADATITVSGTVAEVLHDRYGVGAGVVHNAVDPAVFRPEGGPAPGAPERYVLFVGWDGDEFKGMAEMRQVWRALSGEGRALDLVWVTPRPPRSPAGRVVVAPDQATLAALYRGASVYVCCSRYESFSLPCLEAMASGTPVVATRNTGVLEYARDGENALLADVRDAAGLLARVRRVLDEPGLAARLRDGGLHTADGYSWDAVVARLEEHYWAACAAWSPPADAGDWRFDLAGLRFADEDAEQRLRRHAAATTAGAVAVPVAFPAFEGHRAVRWRTVGRRRGGGPGTARAYLPAHADAPPPDLPYADALRDFAAGRIEPALAGFVDAHRRADGTARAAAGRWIALALLELGRDAEAMQTVASGVELFPDHSDYQYLQAMTGMLTGRRVDGDAYVAAVEALGPATHYDEWFAEPERLVRERLFATAR